jgi:hypothetical protein
MTCSKKYIPLPCYILDLSYYSLLKMRKVQLLFHLQQAVCKHGSTSMPYRLVMCNLAFFAGVFPSFLAIQIGPDLGVQIGFLIGRFQEIVPYLEHLGDDRCQMGWSLADQVLS